MQRFAEILGIGTVSLTFHGAVISKNPIPDEGSKTAVELPEASEPLTIKDTPNIHTM